MLRTARQGGWADNSTSLARYYEAGDPWSRTTRSRGCESPLILEELSRKGPH